MTTDNDERLLSLLALIDNDLETLALSFLAAVPPLIHMAVGPAFRDQAEVLADILTGLGDAHEKGARAIRARLEEKLTHV